MTAKLHIVSEGRCWNNFLHAHLEAFQGPTMEGVNDVLKQYGARILDLKIYEVEFDTEQDLAFFMLKY